MEHKIREGNKKPVLRYTCRASLHILNYQIAFVDGETFVCADIYYLILKIINGKTSSVWSDQPSADV